jgi:hypothetical protein
MAKLKRDRVDCERLRDLHAKAAGYPYPPVNSAHAAQGHGWTTHQDAVVLEDDGKYSYELPTDAELGVTRLARLTAPERAELVAIRAKPEPAAAARIER